MDREREYLARRTDPRRRRAGVVLGAVGLAVLLGSGIAGILLPPGLLAYAVAGMASALVLLAWGFLRLR